MYKIQKGRKRTGTLYRVSIYIVLDTTAARRIDVKSMPEKLVRLKDLLASFCRLMHLPLNTSPGDTNRSVIQQFQESNFGPLPIWEGKKWKNHNQDVSSKRHTQNYSGHTPWTIYWERSRYWWQFWIFCSILSAHAIWAWERIWRVIWPFELNPFGITMSSHA